MPDEEKNHGIWRNRPAVQKAFDADPQRAYHVIVQVLTLEGVAEKLAPLIEAGLCPLPTNEEVLAELQDVRARMILCDIDTGPVDKKIAELSA